MKKCLMNGLLLAGLLGLAFVAQAAPGGVSDGAGQVAAARETRVFDTNTLAARPDIRLQAAFPAEFAPKDHMDAYVLQEFTREVDGIRTVLTLELVSDPPGRINERTGLLEGVYVDAYSAVGINVIGLSPALLDGYRAVLVDFAISPPMIGVTKVMHMQVMHVQVGNHMIYMSCAVDGPKDRAAEVGRVYQSAQKKVCRPFFESLKIVEAAPA